MKMILKNMLSTDLIPILNRVLGWVHDLSESPKSFKTETHLQLSHESCETPRIVFITLPPTSSRQNIVSQRAGCIPVSIHDGLSTTMTARIVCAARALVL